MNELVSFCFVFMQGTTTQLQQLQSTIITRKESLATDHYLLFINHVLDINDLLSEVTSALKVHLSSGEVKYFST